MTKINTAEQVRSNEQCFGVSYWLINIDETFMLRSVRCLIFTAAFNARAPLTNPQKTVKRQGWVESDFSCAQDISIDGLCDEIRQLIMRNGTPKHCSFDRTRSAVFIFVIARPLTRNSRRERSWSVIEKKSTFLYPFTPGVAQLQNQTQSYQ